MDCRQAVEYIHSLERFGIKPGLERIGLLCSALGNPQNNCRFIHVAGTNGKGSTSTLIANVLSRCGFVTGLYTSPYVTDFRERIQLGGRMIDPAGLARVVERVKNAVEENSIEITEFEAVTAAAFLWFSEMKCDYVVLETGLGGRFDATNVIPPAAVSVITSISYDHMNILGSTIEAIAGEKCGIIKPGTKVVTYPLQNKTALGVIKDTCSRLSVPLIIPDSGKISVLRSDFRGTLASYGSLEYRLRLPGEHIVYNSVTAIEAIRALGENIPDEKIIDGFYDTVMPARTELVREKPAVIIDGGHNEDCAAALRAYVQKYLAGKRIVAVSSLMADKDYEAYVSAIAPLADVFIATKASVPRALPARDLCACAEKYCGRCLCIPSPSEAAQRALEEADESDVILVCGSFYLAGDIRSRFTGDENND